MKWLKLLRKTKNGEKICETEWNLRSKMWAQISLTRIGTSRQKIGFSESGPHNLNFIIFGVKRGYIKALRRVDRRQGSTLIILLLFSVTPEPEAE